MPFYVIVRLRRSLAFDPFDDTVYIAQSTHRRSAFVRQLYEGMSMSLINGDNEDHLIPEWPPASIPQSTSRCSEPRFTVIKPLDGREKMTEDRHDPATSSYIRWVVSQNRNRWSELSAEEKILWMLTSFAVCVSVCATLFVCSLLLLGF